MDETPGFSSEQLEAALFAAFDLFDSVQCDFFPMGQTAEQMYKNEWLKGNKILLGVRGRDLAESTREMIKIYDPNIDIQPKKIIMIHDGVPVEIRIISKHYRVFDNFDHVDYVTEIFLMPNPFDAFMRMWRFMH